MRCDWHVTQVCLQMAYPRSSELLPRYLSGEEAIFLHDYPELACFRDMVFLFKALQAPTGDTLPEVRPWDAKDVVLRWSFDAKGAKPSASDSKSLNDNGTSGGDAPTVTLPLARGHFTVHGFNRMLQCTEYLKSSDADELGLGKKPKRAGVLSSLFHFRLFAKMDKPRCPPSGANPSIVAGQPIHSEDDVLHLQQLPDFDGTLRPADVEVRTLLLCSSAFTRAPWRYTPFPS